MWLSLFAFVVETLKIYLSSFQDYGAVLLTRVLMPYYRVLYTILNCEKMAGVSGACLALRPWVDPSCTRPALGEFWVSPCPRTFRQVRHCLGMDRGGAQMPRAQAEPAQKKGRWGLLEHRPNRQTYNTRSAFWASSFFSRIWHSEKWLRTVKMCINTSPAV